LRREWTSWQDSEPHGDPGISSIKLDYREAVAKYKGAKQLVVAGSDHGFADFERYLDSVLSFAKVS